MDSLYTLSSTGDIVPWPSRYKLNKSTLSEMCLMMMVYGFSEITVNWVNVLQ